MGCAFSRLAPRAQIRIAQKRWHSPRRFLTRCPATDSVTLRLPSPSGTRSSGWRRAKGSAIRSALSAGCLSLGRSRDDYPGPTDSRARTPHSVRLRSTNDLPLHRVVTTTIEVIGLYFVWLPDHANGLAHFVESGAARISSSICSIVISLIAALNLHIITRSNTFGSLLNSRVTLRLSEPRLPWDYRRGIRPDEG